ncbi:MAG TPA: hypothetical protein VIW64_03250 [Pyrinomonadaceae bacterium]
MTTNLPPDSETPLTEPHFDEEATVLSAKPVVPLRKIEARERSGKRLALGLTVIFSLIVGAVGGALFYKQRGQKQSTAVLDAAISGAEGIAVAEPTPAPEVVEEVSKTGPAPPSAAPAAAVETRAAAPRPLRMERVRNEKRTKETPIEMDDWEQRRAERIEAWRARRKQEREEMKEARRNRNRADDLLRIREIFEGSRRP